MSDTSTKAVKALIETLNRGAVRVAASPLAARQELAADTLAALLDERDATASFNASAHAQAQECIRDLEADRKVCEQQIRDLEDACKRWQHVSEKNLARAERAEAERDRIKAEYDQNFPCDGGCSYNDGPEETCSRHGRRVSEVWQMQSDAQAEANRLAAKLDAVKDGLRHLADAQQSWIDAGRVEQAISRETIRDRALAILADTDERNEQSNG
jgi:hypothetical protein